MEPVFKDRAEGARRLAEKLEVYRDRRVVVYGLPRGGILTARIVAEHLDVPLDLIITRKIGHPINPDYAVGAITDDGQAAINHGATLTISRQWLSREEQRQRVEAARQRELYLAGRPPIPVAGRTAILVDDWIATGHSMEAALLAVRHRKPARIVVASPVIASVAVERFGEIADEIVAVCQPETLFSVGMYYKEFPEVDDAQVLAALAEPVPQ